MRPEMFTFLTKKQNTYWWNRARRSMGEALLRHYWCPMVGAGLILAAARRHILSIADHFAPHLVVGVHFSPLGLQLAQSRFPKSRLVRSDISRGLPFVDGAFDVVTIFNVIYHGWVKDDGEALCEVARMLRPGGLLLITEPAFPVLAREWDKAVMGVRRYRRPQLVALCRRAGFKTLFASYFTSFGFPILLGMKALKRIKHLVSGTTVKAEQGAENKLLPPALNEMLYAAALTEAKVIGAGVPLPFGVTLVLVAAKILTRACFKHFHRN